MASSVAGHLPGRLTSEWAGRDGIRVYASPADRFFPIREEKSRRRGMQRRGRAAAACGAGERGARDVASGDRRALLVSKGWIQAAALVFVCGFFILGLLAYRTYMAH